MFNTRQVFYMGVPKMSFSYAKRIVINSLFEKKIALPGCLPKACQELSHKVKPFTLSYVLLRDFRNNHLVCVTSAFPVQRNASYNKIDKTFNICTAGTVSPSLEILIYCFSLNFPDLFIFKTPVLKANWRQWRIDLQNKLSFKALVDAMKRLRNLPYASPPPAKAFLIMLNSEVSHKYPK